MEKLNSVMQRGLQSRPKERAYAKPMANVKEVEAFWMRMGLLFPNKWRSTYGDICDKEGEYKKPFLAWCAALYGITKEQKGRAIKLMEQRSADAERLGEEYWPPSYAGFKGLCRIKREHKTYSHLELPYPRAERNRKGKEGIQKVLDAMQNPKVMSDNEADEIIEKAREDGLRELFAEK